MLNHHIQQCTNLVPIVNPQHKEVVPVNEVDVEEIKLSSTFECELSKSGGRGGTDAIVFQCKIQETRGMLFMHAPLCWYIISQTEYSRKQGRLRPIVGWAPSNAPKNEAPKL